MRFALIIFIYLLTFIILDFRSHTFEIFPGIVAWYPPDGLSFAFLLTFGLGFLPVIAITSLVSSIFVYRLPLPFSELVGWAIIISIVYGIAAWFLRRRTRMDIRLHTTRDLLWLITSAAVVSMILAVISISASVANGVILQAEGFWATFQWWVGEMIGILVIAPTLLIHCLLYTSDAADE